MQSLILANASAAMFQGLVYVVLGIPAISIVEFVLVAFMLRPRRSRLYLLFLALLGANYASLFLGGLVLSGLHALIDGAFSSVPIIDRALLITIALFLFGAILSVFIEWPFVHRSVPARSRTIRRTLIATAVANLVSFAGVVFYYFVVSGSATLYTAYEHRETPDFVASSLKGDVNDYWVYYRALDGDIRRVRLDGTEDGRFEGVLTIEYAQRTTPPREVSFRIDGAEPERFRASYVGVPPNPYPEISKPPFYFPAPVRDMQESEGIDYYVRFEGDHGDGMTVIPKGLPGMKRKTMRFVNPFYGRKFGANGFAILPGNVVVLHLGQYRDPSKDDVILVVDVKRQLLSQLAFGRQPVVVHTSDVSDTPDSSQRTPPDIP